MTEFLAAALRLALSRAVLRPCILRSTETVIYTTARIVRAQLEMAQSEVAL
jgi:hypothetical protein